jgi:hypothetical protein
MSPDLRALTFDFCVTDYERLAVPAPPVVPVDDFGRQQVNLAYGAGFGAALLVARRLFREPPELQEEIAARLLEEVRLHGIMIDAIREPRQ